MKKLTLPKNEKDFTFSLKKEAYMVLSSLKTDENLFSFGNFCFWGWVWVEALP
jgi:hypothetical protein